MGRCEHYRPITAADVIRARKQGRTLGTQQAIKSWLSTTKHITPQTPKAPMISEIVETFKVDETLAKKIVREFFDDVLAAMLERRQYYAGIEAATMRGEERGLELGMKFTIKSWLRNRNDITPQTPKLSIVGEVIELFNLDKALAEEIVNDFFDEKFNN